MKRMYGRRKSRGPKIALAVIGAILLIVVVACLLNLNTLLLAFGKGSLKVRKYNSVENALKSSPYYTVTGVTGSGSDKTLTCVSKDEAVAMQVSQSGKNETVTGTVDAGKLKNVNRHDINGLKEKAEDYLSPVLSKDQILGLAANMSSEVLSQPHNNISITKTYGDTQVQVKTAAGGKISFKIVTKSGS